MVYPIRRELWASVLALVLVSWAESSPAVPTAVWTGGTSNQSETSIAIHPDNPNIILCGARLHDPMTGIPGSIGVYWTTDGGNTWSAKEDFHQAGAGDPVVAIRRSDGAFLVGHVRLIGPIGAENLVLWLSYSTDNGTTWGHLQVTDFATDKPQIAVSDDPEAPNYGEIFLSYLDAGNFQVLVERSSTLIPSAWSGPGDVAASRWQSDGYPQYNPQGAVVQVDDDGTAVCVWGYFGGGEMKAIGMNTAEAGQPWGDQFLVEENIDGIEKLFPADQTPEVFRLNGLPSLAIDSSGSDFDGTAYVCWVEDTDGGGATLDADVVVLPVDLQTKAPGGKTTVNQVTSRQQWFSWIECDQTTGALAVAFFDQREAGPGEYTTRLYMAHSLDGGVTWEDEPIGATWIPAVIDGNNPGDPYMGDYIDIAFSNGVAYPCWYDNSDPSSRFLTYVSREPITLATKFVDRSADAGNISSTLSGSPYDATAFDYDGDGRQDLFVSVAGGAGELFRNQLGAPGLEDVPDFSRRTAFEFLSGERPDGLRGLAIADIDQDGDLDVFGAAKTDGGQGYAPRLYQFEALPSSADATDIAPNTGTGGTDLATLADDSWTGAWADVNHDGLMDLYVGRAGTDAGGNPSTAMDDLLMKNLGAGQFKDIASTASINTVPLATTSVSWGALGHDPHLELFVGDAGSSGSRLYRVKEYKPAGNPVYESITSVLPNIAPESYTSVRRSTWADMDSDGYLDLVLCRTNASGDNTFVLWYDPATESGGESGLEAGGFEATATAWASGFGPSGILAADLDLNGGNDLLVLSAATSPPSPPLLLGNENPSQRVFSDRTSFAGLDAETAAASGVVAVDFAGETGSPDGDLDLYLGRDPQNNTAFYYQAKSPVGGDDPLHQWIQVRVEVPDGTTDWPEAGTLVRIEQPAGTVKMTQIVDHGLGRVGSASAFLTFGLGLDTADVEVIARWPGGSEKTVTVTEASFETEVLISADHEPGMMNASATIEVVPGDQSKWTFTWFTPYQSDPALDKVVVPWNGNCAGATYIPTTPGVTHRVQPDLNGGYHHTMIVLTSCAYPCTHTVTMESAMGTRVSQGQDTVSAAFCGQFQQ